MDAVIFDMDGVIFDSEALVMETWKTVADRHGIADIEETCKECLGVNSATSRRIFQNRYGKGFPYDEYKQEMAALFHERAAGGKLKQKPGIRELLTFLQEQGIRTAVASSTRREVVCRELEEGGLLSYFSQVVCGDMVARSKPEPDIFLKACAMLDTFPENVYVIEDSYNGIRAAYRAGMRPIMVPDLAEPTQEMEQLAVCILPSLTAVQQYFEQKLK